MNNCIQIFYSLIIVDSICWNYVNINLMKFAVANQARNYVSHELDISYGSTERTKYDIYGTDLPKGTHFT